MSIKIMNGSESPTVNNKGIPPRLLKIPEVAEWLNVERTTIHAFMNRKVNPIPSHKLGKARRFDRDEVKYWLYKQREGN